MSGCENDDKHTEYCNHCFTCHDCIAEYEGDVVQKSRIQAFINNQKQSQKKLEKSDASKSVIKAAGFKHTVRILEQLLKGA